jgi:hypothetical protein
MNLTLVAFYGPKPDPLTWLVDMLQSALRSELGPAFFPYGMEQIHATIVGLEGWRIGGDVFNSNAVQAFGESSAMDLHGLLLFMKEMPSFVVRFGGFTASGRYPFTSRELHPHDRSFAFNGSTAVMLGWPVAGGTFPMTLNSLRRACSRYNVLHKYFRKLGDTDNDLFLVLGRVDRESILEKKADSVQEALREWLAGQEPVDILVE